LRHKVGSVDRATEDVTSDKSARYERSEKRGKNNIFNWLINNNCTQYYNTCLGPDLEIIRTLMCITIDLDNYFEKIPQKATRYCAALLLVTIKLQNL